MTMRVEIRLPDGTARSFDPQPGESISIGSSGDADVSLRDDRGIDPVHCRLEVLDEHTCRVRDTSAGGTFVNAARITELTLKPHDSIEIGRTILRIALDVGATGAAESAPGPRPARSPSSPRPRPIGRGPRPFYVDLYREHLEEAAFLLEQRGSLRSDPTLSWVDLAEFEERIEAHVDALQLGEALASHVAAEMIEEDDPWVRGAALRVFCRRGSFELAEPCVLSPSLQDGVARAAVVEALAEACPPAWIGRFSSALVGHDPWPPLSVLLQAAAHHDPATASRRAGEVLSHEMPEVRASAARALGCAGEPEARRALVPLLDDPSQEVRRSAIGALLLDAHPAALSACRALADTEPWALTALATCAAPEELLSIRGVEDAPAGAWAAARAHALGAGGTAETVEVLLGDLERAIAPEAAAEALELVTGAGLAEEAFISDEIDEDVLTEEETERAAGGSAPARPDGEPYGEWVTRPSQDARAWRSWLARGGMSLGRGRRHRNGSPLTPRSMVAALISPATSHALRSVTLAELRVRYGAPPGLELAMPVVEQRVRLVSLESWAGAQDRAFEPGLSYLARRRI